jgi:hypothetical protein
MRFHSAYWCSSPSFYAVLLWLSVSAHRNDADRAARVPIASQDCRTHFFVDAYVVQNNRIPSLRIGGNPDRDMSHSLQSTTAKMVAPKFHRTHRRNIAGAAMARLNMCICINCARVINCSAYYFVETKHEQPHIAAQPTFTPRDGSPTIHVNIRTTDRSLFTKSTSDSTSDSNEANNRIWSKETKMEKVDRSTTDSETNRLDEVASTHAGETGETIIPISMTYTEYDVVACADYVEDMNCWIRNMPDEIKRANPNFVPT